MDEKQMGAIMIASVKMVAKNLTDDELNAICMAALLDTDPTHVMGYEKAKTLFTENGGKRMHSTTKDALQAVYDERFPQ